MSKNSRNYQYEGNSFTNAPTRSPYKDKRGHSSSYSLISSLPDRSTNEESQEGNYENKSNEQPFEIEVEDNQPWLKECKSEINGKRKKKDWNDDETIILIEAWSKEEVLYNVKHPFHSNKEEKAKAITKINGQLTQHNITVSDKEIAEKIANLRNYFGAQKRLVEASKKISGETTDLYKSRWKFFDYLTFLSGNLTPRTSKTRIDEQQSFFANNMNHIRSIKSSKPIINDIPLKTVEINTSLKQPISYYYQPTTSTSKVVSTDKAFCHLIGTMLSEINECPEKDYLKLDIQQRIINLKHQISGFQRECYSPPYSMVQPDYYMTEDRSPSETSRAHLHRPVPYKIPERDNFVSLQNESNLSPKSTNSSLMSSKSPT